MPTVLGSSGDTISLAEHRLQKNIMDTVTKCWEKRMEQEDNTIKKCDESHVRLRPSDSATRASVAYAERLLSISCLHDLCEKNMKEFGVGSAASTAAASSGSGGNLRRG